MWLQREETAQQEKASAQLPTSFQTGNDFSFSESKRKIYLVLWGQSKPRLDVSYSFLGFIPLPVWVEKKKDLVQAKQLGSKALSLHGQGPGLVPGPQKPVGTHLQTALLGR